MRRSKRNPLEPHLAKQLSYADVVLLNALEQSASILSEAADDLREVGEHEKAAILEVLAEEAMNQIEFSSAEIIEEGADIDVSGEGGELEAYGEDTTTIEGELADIWADYLSWKEGGYHRRYGAYGDEKTFGALLRDVFVYHGLRVREQVTDLMLIDAAQDAYKARVVMIKKLNEGR